MKQRRWRWWERPKDEKDPASFHCVKMGTTWKAQEGQTTRHLQVEEEIREVGKTWNGGALLAPYAPLVIRRNKVSFREVQL